VTGLHVGRRRSRGSVLDKGKRILLLEYFQNESGGHRAPSSKIFGVTFHYSWLSLAPDRSSSCGNENKNDCRRTVTPDMPSQRLHIECPSYRKKYDGVCGLDTCGREYEHCIDGLLEVCMVKRLVCLWS